MYISTLNWSFADKEVEVKEKKVCVASSVKSRLGQTAPVMISDVNFSNTDDESGKWQRSMLQRNKYLRF